MWAYCYNGTMMLASLKRVERPEPEPGPYDIVIRMHAAALNYRDVALARGQYHISVRPPLIPLSDRAGEVVQIGSAVQRFHVGDLVAPVYLPDWLDGPVTPRAGRQRLGGPTDGVLAEFTCVHEEEAVLRHAISGKLITDNLKELL
jgi:NADPH:quinone reductase-like Zn-dependent oxidoreductase